jgi:dethiobiotin synthetase
MTRFFVTGTDTGVGKTEVSAALLSLLRDAGHAPFAFKPCESGGTGDAERLREAAGPGQPLDEVCLYRLRAPLAPAMAARQERRRVDLRRVERAFRAFGPTRAGVVEGAGGLFVPLTPRADVIDLIERLALPVVLVARAGLGTVNHTTLSLRALAERGLSVAAVVLSRGSPVADPSVPLNRAELERRFPRVRFVGPVPYVADERRRRFAFLRALGPLVERRGG